MQRARSASTARSGCADRPLSRRTRDVDGQIDFRLGPHEYARLVDVSALFAMTPTALARILTVRGVDRVRYEERRDR